VYFGEVFAEQQFVGIVVHFVFGHGVSNLGRKLKVLKTFRPVHRVEIFTVAESVSKIADPAYVKKGWRILEV
jgi:hypothetical protein